MLLGPTLLELSKPSKRAGRPSSYAREQAAQTMFRGFRLGAHSRVIEICPSLRTLRADLKLNGYDDRLNDYKKISVWGHIEYYLDTGFHTHLTQWAFQDPSSFCDFAREEKARIHDEQRRLEKVAQEDYGRAKVHARYDRSISRGGCSTCQERAVENVLRIGEDHIRMRAPFFQRYLGSLDMLAQEVDKRGLAPVIRSEIRECTIPDIAVPDLTFQLRRYLTQLDDVVERDFFWDDMESD